MATVIQELAGESVTLDFAHVRERVEDWQQRLSALYGQIRSWLPEYIADVSETVEMQEEVMREYGVAPVRLPVLRISADGHQVAKFVPRGLWIIGANGRVDLFARKGQFIIFDRSEYFLPSRWEIAPSLQRRHPTGLSREALLSTIR